MKRNDGQNRSDKGVARHKTVFVPPITKTGRGHFEKEEDKFLNFRDKVRVISGYHKDKKGEVVGLSDEGFDVYVSINGKVYDFPSENGNRNNGQKDSLIKI